MTRLAALVLGLAAGVALAGDKADKSAGVKHTSEEGKYTAVFPSKTTERSDVKPTATTAGNLPIVTAQCETGGVVYSVTFVDYPERFGIVSSKELLDGVVNGMKGSDGKVAAEEISLDGVSGRQVTITAGENTVKGKVFLDGHRVYFVLACGKKSSFGPAADKFLDSFAWAK